MNKISREIMFSVDELQPLEHLIGLIVEVVTKKFNGEVSVQTLYSERFLRFDVIVKFNVAENLLGDLRTELMKDRMQGNALKMIEAGKKI